MERPDTLGASGSGLWLEWERAGMRSRLPLSRPLTIGRDAASDVCLTEPTVSRRHAIVSVVGDRPQVNASTSTNGIVLDQGRTNRATLSSGQPFKIGDTVFRVVETLGREPAGPRPVAVLPAIAVMSGVVTGGAFCIRCGAAMSSSGPRFCIVCGYDNALLGQPASAPPAQPHGQPQGYPPPAPSAQGYGQPSETSQGFGIARPTAAANSGRNLVVLGAIGLVAVIIAGAFLTTAPGAGHSSSPGSLSIDPSVFTCTGETHRVIIDLPASVQAADQITIKESTDPHAGVFDTKSVQEWGFTKQADGSWQLVDTQAFYAYICAFYIPRSYTMYALDSNGNVLAQAPYSQP
jgi:pSer/pThr/pTyr-binding forkhead associated (FHA) protein